MVANGGQVAQSVEQRTENPCVGGSIPPLATTSPRFQRKQLLTFFYYSQAISTNLFYASL